MRARVVGWVGRALFFQEGREKRTGSPHPSVTALSTVHPALEKGGKGTGRKDFLLSRSLTSLSLSLSSAFLSATSILYFIFLLAAVLGNH